MTPAVWMASLGLGMSLLLLAYASTLGLGKRQKQRIGELIDALTPFEVVAAPQTKRDSPIGALARRLGATQRETKFGRATINRLALAGKHEPDDYEDFLSQKIILLVLGLLAGILLFVGSDGQYPWALALPVLGFFTPDLLVYNSAQKRQAEIGRGLPDAIDLLNLCVESGLGFEAAMSRVSRRGGSPIAEEFARFNADLKLGKSRSEALKDMGERNENKQLRRFVAAMRQADRLGIQISQVLSEQASDIREQRRESARAQAQKVTVKILAPVITCFLPATFIVIIGPAALRIIDGLSGTG